MEYHCQEKIQIIKWYYGGHSLREIIDLFIVAFEDRPIPSVSTIRRIVSNFEKFGCLSPKNHKRSAENAENFIRDVTVCASFENNPEQSLLHAGNELNISAHTVRNILKKYKYKCYKIKKSHELLPRDYIQRMEFCETVMERGNVDNEFISNILFTDESSFTLTGLHNPSRVRYWSRDNRRRFYTRHTQYPKKLNVWAGVIGNHIVGPFFIDGNLNGDRYLHLLQHEIVPALRQLEDINFQNVWFQQDGCPAHCTRAVCDFLNETFPDRLIAKFGTIKWPARSPDLSVNDFFLWGHVKSSIYGFQEQRARDLNELGVKITNALTAIPHETFFDVRREFYDRLGHCLAQEGGLFEHLL